MFKGWLGTGGGKDDQASVEEADDQEDFGTMRRLDEDDTTGVDGSDEAFGPAAVLLVGFSAPEFEGFRNMMLSMEADMFKISPCTKAMFNSTLEEALTADCPAWEQPPLGTRRAVVLSGMFGGEVVEVVSAYRESDLPPAVFCCAVPNNMNTVVRDLITEVVAEDATMRRLAAEREAAASCTLDDQSVA